MLPIETVVELLMENTYRFDGTVELTLRDVSDMMTAMGHEFRLERAREDR